MVAHQKHRWQSKHVLQWMRRQPARLSRSCNRTRSGAFSVARASMRSLVSRISHFSCASQCPSVSSTVASSAGQLRKTRRCAGTCRARQQGCDNGTNRRDKGTSMVAF